MIRSRTARRLGLYGFGLGVGLYLVALAGAVSPALAGTDPAKPPPLDDQHLVWLWSAPCPECPGVGLVSTRPPDSVLVDRLRRQLRIERARHSARVGKLIRALRRERESRTYRGPHLDALTCIASHEARSVHGGIDWRANTGNGYYGGLQMDRTFQATYAPALVRRKGTADNWTPAEQMRAADRAIAVRGFSPWPNTARVCGLL